MKWDPDMLPKSRENDRDPNMIPQSHRKDRGFEHDVEKIGDPDTMVESH